MTEYIDRAHKLAMFDDIREMNKELELAVKEQNRRLALATKELIDIKKQLLVYGCIADPASESLYIEKLVIELSQPIVVDPEPVFVPTVEAFNQEVGK